MQSQQQQLGRSDSPIDNNHQNMLHHIHSQDSIYTIHASQNGMYNHSNSNNAMHIQSDYPLDLDAQKHHHQQQQQQQHQQGKLNGFGSYRNSFTAYPNSNRQRHSVTSNTFREPQFYAASSADVFPPQMTSPVQSHMQAYDSRASFDFGGISQGAPKSSYIMDHYSVSSAMLPSHQGGGKPGANQQQPQHGSYASQTAPYASNGLHLSSQTPYGPHVPTSGPTSASSVVSPGAGPVGPPGLTAPAMSMVNGAANTSQSNNEEISTIFVVGFPEDMQVCISLICEYMRVN